MIAVFGAGGGLGSEIVRHYRSGDEDVLALTRSDADLRDEVQVASLISKIHFDHPPWERWIIINAAATCHNSSIKNMDMNALRSDWESNVLGAFNLMKHLLPCFKKRPHSSVTLLSSVVASRGVFGASSYGSSKSALTGLMKSAVPEFARVGARVNILELGYYDSGMIRQVDEDYKEELVKRIPLGRLGNVYELCHAVNFVATNSYLNGASVRVDGGLV